MQNSMLHTVYSLLSISNQVRIGLTSELQGITPLLVGIDPINYASWQQKFIELAQEIDHALKRKGLGHKTVVGFGGGFSAGKSRFINSLLGIDALPEALEPCTAVPTYLTQSPKESYQACNLFGHSIELRREQLGQLRHFVDSAHSINLGQLIQHINLGSPKIKWDNIALLDTPGYSKADGQHQDQNDENIALNQLSAAQYVVWLVNAKNGTIRDEDLQFLQKIQLSQPVFVVLTQSDLVNRADLQPIIDGISKHLSNKGIAVAGIMAWAAPISQDHGERLLGDDILAWFEKINQPVWSSYQDKLDFLISRLVLIGQEESSSLEESYLQIDGLLDLQELTTEQKKVMKRYATEKINKKSELNTALLKLCEQYAVWSKSIADLGIDSSLSVEGVIQKKYSDEDIKSFYDMGGLYSENVFLRDGDKALGWYVKAAIGGHEQAFREIKSLAKDGHSKACYWLAEIYLKSRLKKTRIAAKWYATALALGEPLALAPACQVAVEDFGDLQYQMALLHKADCSLLTV